MYGLGAFVIFAQQDTDESLRLAVRGVLGGTLFRADGACCSGGACDLAANGPGVPDPRRAG